MKKFFSFLRTQDRQLAAEVTEKYKEFTGVDDEYLTEITEGTEVALPTAGACATSIKCLGEQHTF